VRWWGKVQVAVARSAGRYKMRQKDVVRLGNSVRGVEGGVAGGAAAAV